MTDDERRVGDGSETGPDGTPAAPVASSSGPGGTTGGEPQPAEPPRARPPAPCPPPRYRPPAPYPPPADAVPGYVPPAGRVWAPPAAPVPSGATPVAASRPAAPPLDGARPLDAARWGWKHSLGGLLLGIGPFALLYASTYGMTGDIEDVVTDEVTLATALIFLVSSVISYGWQLFAAWLFSVRAATRKLLAWGFRRPTAAFFWTIPVTLVAAWVVSYLNDLVFDPPEQDIVEAFPPTAAGIALFAVVAVVMAPLAEEVFFRGFLFRGFANSWGWVSGAAVSGAVFSLAHLQLTLFFPLFVLGFGLAWVYERTGSLWTSITLHAVFNGVAVLAWALTS